MTVSAIEPAIRAGGRRAIRFGAAHDVVVVTRRNLKRIVRTPSLLAASSIQPILFVLLFRYVFGGSIHVPGANYPYVDYLLPGIFVPTSLFGVTTAVAMATDLGGGMIDRFRSLPMARSAVLAGRCIADLIRSVLVVALILAVGTLVGFRFHNGVLPAIAAVGLVLVFGFSFMWLFALVGMLVKDPETAQLAGFVPLFPFMFASFRLCAGAEHARLAAGLRPQPTGERDGRHRESTLRGRPDRARRMAVRSLDRRLPDRVQLAGRPGLPPDLISTFEAQPAGCGARGWLPGPRPLPESLNVH